MISPDVMSGEGVPKCPAFCVRGAVSAIRLLRRADPAGSFALKVNLEYPRHTERSSGVIKNQVEAS
jgi:hypothetical protein